LDTIAFVAAQIILRLTFPVSVALLFGVGVIATRKSPRTQLVFGVLCVSWLWLTATPATGLLLIRPIEEAAGPYAEPESLSRAGVKYVVVLSGGFREGNLTASDRLGCSMLRLVEGVRIWRGIPGAKLILTGGLIPGLSEDMTIAEALAKAAEDFGVPRNAMALETQSWTTEDQARAVAGIVGDAPFALVTSAYHLPRSRMLFQFQGLKPIPAPADFLARRISLGYNTWIPQAAGLGFTEIAIKERLLFHLQTLRNRIAHTGP
jgi:uncharacterized SAM-binding protein YcdF (DUF218 family)